MRANGIQEPNSKAYRAVKVGPVRFRQDQTLTSLRKCEILVKLFEVPERLNDGTTDLNKNLTTMLSALFYLVPHLAASDNSFNGVKRDEGFGWQDPRRHEVGHISKLKNVLRSNSSDFYSTQSRRFELHERIQLEK